MRKVSEAFREKTVRRLALGLAACLALGTAARGADPSSVFDDSGTPATPTQAERPTSKPAPPTPRPSDAPPEAPIAPAPAPAQSSAPPSPLAEVPSAHAVAAAQRRLRIDFKSEYAIHDPASRAAFASKLLCFADPTTEAASRFAMYAEARDMAASAGDCKTAMSAIDALASHFKVSAAELKLKTATLLLHQRAVTCDRAELSRQLLRATDQALSAGQYEPALQLAALADTSALEINDSALAASARQNAQRAQTCVIEASRAAAALEKLRTDPTDPASNLTAGRFLCLMKGDWEKGLPLLARGSDPELKLLAAHELAHPNDVESIMSLAGLWWSMADKHPSDQAALRARAASLYQQAVPNLKGLELALAQKRLATVLPQKSAESPTFKLIRADYHGDGGGSISLVDAIETALKADPFTPIGVGNGWAGDPADGSKKYLALSCRVGGKIYDHEFTEGEIAIVPPLPEEGVVRPGASVAFKIIAARYGADKVWIDVTDVLRARAQNHPASLEISNEAFGKDPIGFVSKHLVVWCEYQGRRHVRLGDEHTEMSLEP